MGVVIDFPSRDVSMPSRSAVSSGDFGQVVILPVIRIERYDDEPAFTPAMSKSDPRRRRKRRASRG